VDSRAGLDELEKRKFLTLPGLEFDPSAVQPVKILIFFFFNLHSGGWSPNWVQSARRPFIGLLNLPRVIVRMENLVQ
jgi:hypothetical protein